MLNTKDKSLGELFADLSRETSNLVRKEVQLAKTEMSENLSRLAKNAAMLVVAAVLVVFATQALVATAILARRPKAKAWATGSSFIPPRAASSKAPRLSARHG